MITDSKHSLTLDDLSLTDNPDTLGSKSRGWAIELLTDGADWGNPTPVTQEIQSFLSDGSLESTDSYDNREMTVNLVLSGGTSRGLAMAEAALVEAQQGARRLTWVPPDKSITGSGEACVFDVVRCEVEHVKTEDLVQLELERYYTLTISALPFTRSDTQIVVDAPPTDPGVALQTTPVDEASSSAGWAARGSKGAQLSATGGKVAARYTNNSGKAVAGVWVEVHRANLNLSLPAGYLRVVYAQPGAGRQGPYSTTISANGAPLTEVARDGAVAWYQYPGGTLTSFTARYSHGLSSAVGSYLAIEVDSVRHTNLPQDGSSGKRQVSRSMRVHGTVRTQGTLAVVDDTPAGLGSVLVYTAAQQGADFAPPLRSRLTSGNPATDDGSLVSGVYTDLGTVHTFDLPAGSVQPGGYLLMARVRNPSAGSYSIAWQGLSMQGAIVLDAGTDFPKGTAAGSMPTNTWTVVPVARMLLPTFKLGSAGQVRVTMQATGLQLDEAWLFNMDTGQLTWVECGDGTPVPGGVSSRLWLDSADLDSPVPAATHGTAADRSDSRGGGVTVKAFGRHQLVPPMSTVFVVTTGSVSSGFALSYFARYHTHVVNTWDDE